MRTEDALERRIVTVLFADLVGFTTLSEQFDAEDIAAIQDRYFAAVRDTIGRYGGRLEKFIGDAAMAVFGVPAARDDDAERAVRSGLALVHAVQQLGAGLGLDDDVLRLRVGINTGEAVVAATGTDEGRVTGDTVNTAARFQTAAPVGGVLVGQTTALAVADVAEFGEELHLELKGKAEPTAARVVMGFRPEPSRETAMGRLRAPTLGREVELAAVSQALDRARAGGVERWVVVAPPGVGKSRLLREVAEIALARGGTAVWRSRSRPDAVSPFAAISGLFVSAFGPDMSRNVALETLRARLDDQGTPGGRAQVVAEVCAALVWPPEGDGRSSAPSEDRDALFAAWLEGLDALAGDATQVWLIEDVHWAGGDVLAFLDLAGSGGSRARAPGRLVIATARPSLLEIKPDWASQDAARRVLRLSTLDSSDASDFVKALVGDALPVELVDRIVRQSDGNCLFIEELLRTWISVGTLVPSSDAGPTRWRLAVSATDVPLPQSVQQIYAAQLDDLPPQARRLARRASVAGRRFPLRALEPLDVTSDGLDPLRRRELLTGPIPEPLLGAAFAYRHALLRDAGYASLARAERARLHARLARWLEEAAGERVAEVAEQIAGHYAAAHDSAPALASTIDGDLDRDAARSLAADWYERAAQAALAVSAHEAARELLRRSIERTPHTSSLDQARRWERLGDATAFAADMTEGAKAYETAIATYRASMASDRSDAAVSGFARATAALADVCYQQLRFKEAAQMADAGIAELLDVDDASRARLLTARAMGSLGANGPSPGVGTDLEEALALARASGDARLELRVNSELVLYRSDLGAAQASEWEAIARQALELGEIVDAASASINAALMSVDDAPRNVASTIERAREVAQAHGRTEELGWLAFVEAEAALAAGDWDRVLERCVTAMDVGEANSYYRMTVRTIHIAVPVAAARDDRRMLERAARWYSGLDGNFEFPDSPYSRIVRPAQDLELAAAGLRPGYVPEPEPRIASFNDDPSGPSWSAALDRVMRSWVEAGQLDAAERALDAMAVFIDKTSRVSELGRGTYLLMRGRVAAGRGNQAEAITSTTQALARFRVSDAPWWKAKAIRLLERSGAADQQLLGEVEQIEKHLGAIRPTA